MGQRHQIYVRLPKKFYFEGNCNNRPEETIGAHHQWLYGRTAIQLLGNFFQFTSKQDKDFWKNRYNDPKKVLEAIYSFDHTTGYYHDVWSDLEAECEDPRRGDNNDGITVIDLTCEKPAYCFVSLHDLECAAEARSNIKSLTPMSAFEYLNAYYPKFDFPKWQKERREVSSDDSAKLKAECEKLVERIDAEVISAKRLKEIFPKMFAKGMAAV